MEQISPQEAKRLIDEEGARLIDVREDYEWQEMRIPGAELMPLSEYEDDPGQLDEAAITIFHCAHGTRSLAAGDLYLSAHPNAKIYNLDGGIAAWASRGLPTKIGPE